MTDKFPRVDVINPLHFTHTLKLVDGEVSVHLEILQLLDDKSESLKNFTRATISHLIAYLYTSKLTTNEPIQLLQLLEVLVTVNYKNFANEILCSIYSVLSVDNFQTVLIEETNSQYFEKFPLFRLVLINFYLDHEEFLKERLSTMYKSLLRGIKTKFDWNPEIFKQEHILYLAKVRAQFLRTAKTSHDKKADKKVHMAPQGYFLVDLCDCKRLLHQNMVCHIPYFANMIQNSNLVLDMNEFGEKTFDIFLEDIYTVDSHDFSKKSISINIVMELMGLYDRFCLHDKSKQLWNLFAEMSIDDLTRLLPEEIIGAINCATPGVLDSLIKKLSQVICSKNIMKWYITCLKLECTNEEIWSVIKSVNPMLYESYKVIKPKYIDFYRYNYHELVKHNLEFPKGEIKMLFPSEPSKTNPEAVFVAKTDHLEKFLRFISDLDAVASEKTISARRERFLSLINTIQDYCSTQKNWGYAYEYGMQRKLVSHLARWHLDCDYAIIGFLSTWLLEAGIGRSLLIMSLLEQGFQSKVITFFTQAFDRQNHLLISCSPARVANSLLGFLKMLQICPPEFVDHFLSCGLLTLIPVLQFSLDFLLLSKQYGEILTPMTSLVADPDRNWNWMNNTRQNCAQDLTQFAMACWRRFDIGDERKVRGLLTIMKFTIKNSQGNPLAGYVFQNFSDLLRVGKSPVHDFLEEINTQEWKNVAIEDLFEATMIHQCILSFACLELHSNYFTKVLFKMMQKILFFKSEHKNDPKNIPCFINDLCEMMILTITSKVTSLDEMKSQFYGLYFRIATNFFLKLKACAPLRKTVEFLISVKSTVYVSILFDFGFLKKVGEMLKVTKRDETIKTLQMLRNFWNFLMEISPSNESHWRSMFKESISSRTLYDMMTTEEDSEGLCLLKDITSLIWEKNIQSQERSRDDNTSLYFEEAPLKKVKLE